MKINRTRRMAALLTLMVVMTIGLESVPAQTALADGFANDAFTRAYNAGGLGQTLWGSPRQTLNETYFNSKNRQRQVQYFDKGRMEYTYPESLPGFVGDGKLVMEMVTGRMQVSDTVFWQYDGAEMPVSGGTTFAANPGAPSYRSFQILLAAQPSQVGRAVTTVLNSPEEEGSFLGVYSRSTDSALGTLAKNEFYVPETGHNVPDVFWRYLNQPNADGLPAFNWLALFGRPITDSYWTKVRDGGQVLDVLVQLFERRTLLYNPAAAAGSQVESGYVGRDYFRWRYEQPELPVYDTSFSTPDTSANARVTPSIGEAGTTFVLEASGFKPNEVVNLYVRLVPDGGLYVQPALRADSNGKLTRRRRTRPLESRSDEVYYVLTGQESGVQALWHIKVIGSTRYTPAVEAIQPESVPEGQNAALDRKVLRLGETSLLFGGGFLPGEELKGWITTPLNRVVGWPGLIRSNSTIKDYDPLLFADEEGTILMELPAPGTVLPGVYAFTLYGTVSKNTAIAFFRVRSGPAIVFDPFWGNSEGPTPPGPRPATNPPDPATLYQQRDRYRQTSYQTEPA